MRMPRLCRAAARQATGMSPQGHAKRRAASPEIDPARLCPHLNWVMTGFPDILAPVPEIVGLRLVIRLSRRNEVMRMRKTLITSLAACLLAAPAPADVAFRFGIGNFAQPYAPRPYAQPPRHYDGNRGYGKRDYGDRGYGDRGYPSHRPVRPDGPYRGGPAPVYRGPGTSAAEIRGRAQGRYGPAMTPSQRAAIEAQRARERKDYWRHKRRYGPAYPPLYYGDTIRREEQVVVIQPPAPIPPPKPEFLEPILPPDMRGPRFAPARGLPPPIPGYVVGEPLPPGEPYVALDWWQFDLPEPVIGREYIRIGNDVLLIDSASRMVLERVEPG
ncbi:RcnB family protein [Rhodobacteraceae bacterium NNCM2]|nr:RcnB family protein [Coraliihabitans acroporae]